MGQVGEVLGHHLGVSEWKVLLCIIWELRDPDPAKRLMWLSQD